MYKVFLYIHHYCSHDYHIFTGVSEMHYVHDELKFTILQISEEHNNYLSKFKKVGA